LCGFSSASLASVSSFSSITGWLPHEGNNCGANHNTEDAEDAA
jgi:hypothetical protein